MGYHGILWDGTIIINETTDDQSLDPFFLYIHTYIYIITFIASHCSGPFDQICLRNWTRLSLDHGWDVTGHLYLSSAHSEGTVLRGFRDGCDVSQRLRQTRQTRQT